MKNKIAIIGLGYVGLPLALAFSKKFNVTGIDSNKKKVDKYKIKYKRQNIIFGNRSFNISNCNIFIIAVPTPIYDNKKPDLTFLKNACITVAKSLKKEDLVIFESTVYPGLTEGYCVKLIEKKSKLSLNNDFYVGYSPERINPGDKKHTLEKIIKVTSGSNKKAAKLVDKLYKSIIKAGTYKAPSIKIAEASKVIENTQRDLNIAFVNELKIIFDKMRLDTNEILKAASTKWNFLDFKPGLVGGHCIGVDPYYLTYQSKKIGYNPKFILSGREINDNMAKYHLSLIKKQFSKNKITFMNSKILVLGLTFKENCEDVRNSKAIEIINYLSKRTNKLYIYDPIADTESLNRNIKNKLIKKLNFKNFDSIIVLASHNIFKIQKKKILSLLNKKGFIYEIKNLIF